MKHTGNGFMVVFNDVDRALEWSLDIRESFEQRSDLDVRLGMAAGEPVDRDDDIFGAAVTMANRICSSAGPEQIFVSDVVHDLGIEGVSDSTVEGPKCRKDSLSRQPSTSSSAPTEHTPRLRRRRMGAVVRGPRRGAFTEYLSGGRHLPPTTAHIGVGNSFPAGNDGHL